MPPLNEQAEQQINPVPPTSASFASEHALKGGPGYFKCNPKRDRTSTDTPMPSRLLREGILDSEAVNSLTFEAEVFYRRLMSVVDDFGRFDARPGVLRARLYPLKVDKISEANIVKWLALVETAGLVVTYASEGKPFLQLHRLGAPRAKESKYPSPPEQSCQNDCKHPKTDENNQNTQMKTDENGCLQVKASVPYSYSGSGAYSGADSYSGAGAGTVASLPDLAAAWNSLGKPFGQIRMTTSREKSLKSRWADAHWREHWREALTRIPNSPFLRGENDRGWIADVDFFLRQDTVQKIMEGKYACGPTRGKSDLITTMTNNLNEFINRGQSDDT